MAERSPERMAADRRGQSSTIGVVLLIGLIMLGTGVIVVYGGQAIDETQQSATVARVEHSMTLFDSRAAMVALGETNSHQVQFAGVGGGKYTVEPDSGWIRVVPHNYTGTGENETIYRDSLGSIRYQNDQTVVAYQGGGVWRSRGNGSSMISPPEFHYRQSTLTLPVIQISGTDSATGRTTVLIESTTEARRVFPNRTTSTNDGPGAPYDNQSQDYVNPVINGTVTVTIHSEYYQGWAQYLRRQTSGNVTVNHSAQQVTIELLAPGVVGDFQMPSEGNAIDANGMAEGHSVENFTITLDEQTTFDNMYFSFWAESGGKEFEMFVYIPGGISGSACKDGTFEESEGPGDLVYEIYYHNEATPEGHHGWSNTSIDPNDGPIRLQCSGGGLELYARFTGDTSLTFDQLTTEQDKWYHTWDGSFADHADFNHTEHDEPTRFYPGNTTTSNHLVNHYFAKFSPNMELVVHSGSGASGRNRINFANSGGTLEYESATGGGYITFLHITENGIRVEFE